MRCTLQKTAEAVTDIQHKCAQVDAATLILDKCSRRPVAAAELQLGCTWCGRAVQGSFHDLCAMSPAPQEQLSAAVAAGRGVAGKKASLQRERRLAQRLAAQDAEIRQLRARCDCPEADTVRSACPLAGAFPRRYHRAKRSNHLPLS